MASFSDRFRYTYHAVPLHALKPLFACGRLLSKSDLGSDHVAHQRQSTGAIDRILGFSSFVHFYLPEKTELDFAPLPILQTQISESRVPAFPHAVLVFDTQRIQEEDCVICNFNIARSKPKVDDSRSYGSVLSSDTPDSVLEHWRAFRATVTDPHSLRRSAWESGLEVPVLTGSALLNRPNDIGYGSPKHADSQGTKVAVPELLLRSPVLISGDVEVCVFSNWDHETVSLLKIPRRVKTITATAYKWYTEQDRVAVAVREKINGYFCDSAACFPSDLDFDRPRPKPPQNKPKKVNEAQP